MSKRVSKMYKIEVTSLAQNDLKQAVYYIANELKNSISAMTLADEFEKEALSLAEMPNRFKVVDDEFLASKSIRFFIVKNYLAFYIVNEETKTVSIIRFLYAKRNWNDILKINEEELRN